MNINFATNREPDHPTRPTTFGKEFSRAGAQDMRFGLVEVDEEEKITIYLDSEWVEGESLPSTNRFDVIRSDMAKHKQDIIVYIHGYASTFESTVLNSAEISKNLLLPVFLFTWPSDGSLSPFTAYKSDRHDAEMSGAAVARAFLKLRDFLHSLNPEDNCKQKIHLIAHSMGNWVLQNAIQKVVQFSPPTRIFDQVILAAPDADADALSEESKLLPLTRYARRVTVLMNEGDRALDISDWTKGNPPRLGSTGPTYPDRLPQNVITMDCTPVVHGFQEHQYYRENPQIVKLLRGLLWNANISDLLVESMGRQVYEVQP